MINKSDNFYQILNLQTPYSPASYFSLGQVEASSHFSSLPPSSFNELLHIYFFFLNFSINKCLLDEVICESLLVSTLILGWCVISLLWIYFVVISIFFEGVASKIHVDMGISCFVVNSSSECASLVVKKYPPIRYVLHVLCVQVLICRIAKFFFTFSLWMKFFLL